MISITYDDFIKKSKYYCEIIERRDEYELNLFLQKMLISLIDLYRSGLFLEPIGDVEKCSRREIANDEHDYLFKSLKNKLALKNNYTESFNPTDLEDEEISIGELADDLSDIYRDFKDSLNLFTKGNADEKKLALWDFRFKFINHSSAHICDAIRAIHYYEIDCKFFGAIQPVP